MCAYLWCATVQTQNFYEENSFCVFIILYSLFINQPAKNQTISTTVVSLVIICVVHFFIFPFFIPPFVNINVPFYVIHHPNRNDDEGKEYNTFQHQQINASNTRKCEHFQYLASVKFSKLFLLMKCSGITIV